MKTFFKTFFRMFKRHITRLVSIILMILVSVGFCAGFGMATENIETGLEKIYTEQNISDLIIKSTSKASLDKAQLEILENLYGKENILIGGSLEVKDGESELGGMKITFEGLRSGVTRFYCFSSPLDELKQNIPQFIDKYESNTQYHAYAERSTQEITSFASGDEFTVKIPMGMSFTFGFKGTVCNPLHIATQRDPSMQFEGEHLSDIIYITDFPLLTGFLQNDVYITLPERPYAVMSDNYKTLIETEKQRLNELLGSSVVVLSLFENYSFASLSTLCKKVRSLAYAVVAMFLTVTLLVTVSTMTRLLEEERNQIACLITLGCSPFKVISKYLLFALTGMAIGGTGAFYAGQGVSYLVYLNFYWMYSLPPYPAKFSTVFFIIVTMIICLSTLLATLFVGIKMTRQKPVVLMRPKAPKAGARLLLERVTPLWKRISFKYKNMLRNLFRFKTRFFMTVVAVTFSTALIFAGFAVMDCCVFQDIGSDALIGMSIIILVFAALLNAVVMYTLTTINVSEREKELATLMVLGYKNHEVILYIFREIYLTSAIGIIAGIPVGLLLCLAIFDLLSFGSIGGIALFVYLTTPALSVVFTLLISLMLSPKIKKINMNESLKANE